MQVSISSVEGSRLSGGLHLTMFVMKTSFLESPASMSSSSRNLPADPTKGSPLMSSDPPGASPISSTLVSVLPTPGTAFVRVFQRSHFMQTTTSAATTFRSSLFEFLWLILRHLSDWDNATGTRYQDMCLSASVPFIPTSTPRVLAFDVTAFTCPLRTSSKVFTPLITAAATPSFSALSMLRKPHMTNPFSPMTRSNGGLSGKSARMPVQLFPSILIVVTLIMRDTFLT